MNLLIGMVVWLHSATVAKAAIVNDRCSIFGFLPFAVAHDASQLNYGVDATGGDDNDDQDLVARHLLGFSQMAAGMMAVDHFNARDPSVVPQLADLGDCPIQLNLTGIFDSDELDHEAVQILWALGETPCALAGPYWDIPGLELSVFATAMKVPMVVHRSFNTRLLYPVYSPFTTVVYPALETGVVALADFLVFISRSRFVSFLHATSDGSIQTKEILHADLDRLNFVVSEHSYVTSVDNWNLEHSISVFNALENLRSKRFRTIVVSPNYPASAIPAIADAAAELGMLDPPYLWIWFGPFDYSFTSDKRNIMQLLQGSFWITPTEYVLSGDPFHQAWRRQGVSMVDRLNEANPIKSRSALRFTLDFFQKGDPQPGSGFFYDAIINIGIGACLANGTDGISHRNGIQKAVFNGVTGTVQYGAHMNVPGMDNTTELRGERLPSSVIWTAANVIKAKNSAGLQLAYTATYNGTWIQTDNFTFADDKMTPPDVYYPDPNYLTRAARAAGLTLMAIVLLMVFVTLGWVYKNRAHHVLLASQPFFLYLLAFGSMVSSLSILTTSVDEKQGWSLAQLGKACMATMWLVTLGCIITYGALFSKLWRVNRVLQGTRRKVSVRDAALPASLLVAVALVILSVWTAVNPLHWDRDTVNESTGESVGHCAGDNFEQYLLPLVGVILISLGSMAFMAYKTKDVDDAYSESLWILILIGVQFEIVVVGLPVVIILQDVNPNIRYLVMSFVIFAMSLSTLLLIVGPKFMSHRRAVHGIKAGVRRGARVQGKVSGLEQPELGSDALMRRQHETQSTSSIALPPQNSEDHTPLNHQPPEGTTAPDALGI